MDKKTALCFCPMSACVALWMWLVCAATARAYDGLPTVFIDTPGGIALTSRELWTDSVSILITDADSTLLYSTETARARLRGHSSFSKPKKPYAIRLPEAASLLGMPKGRRWVLLANFMDHSGLRNRLALEVARATSLAWTPQSRMVDVVVNGAYRGLYTLAEQVGEGHGRVETDSARGYIVEASSYEDGAFRFRSAIRRLPFELKWPKRGAAARLHTAQEEIDSVERLLYHQAPTRETLRLIGERIDLLSFADWFIVHEITMNAEPNGPRSCFFYKSVGGRIAAGPVWDFDLAFIAVDVDSGGDLRPTRRQMPHTRRLTEDSLYNDRALWYDRLLQFADFRALVARRWSELRPRFVSLSDSVAAWTATVRPSALRNDELWQGQDPARFDLCPTFDESSANLLSVYLRRIEALDRLLAAEGRFPQS